MESEIQGLGLARGRTRRDQAQPHLFLVDPGAGRRPCAAAQAGPAEPRQGRGKDQGKRQEQGAEHSRTGIESAHGQNFPLLGGR